MHSGVWVCVLIKSGAATELEQDEAPDVLTVGVAAGDAGTRYDSSFSRFYQRDKKRKKLHWCSRESRSNTLIQKYSNVVCVCVCVFVRVHVCYVSATFETSTGSQSLRKFSFRLWWSGRTVIETTFVIARLCSYSSWSQWHTLYNNTANTELISFGTRVKVSHTVLRVLLLIRTQIEFCVAPRGKRKENKRQGEETSTTYSFNIS